MTSDLTESVDLRHSLITAASCWLAAIFVFYFHCDNPWWAVISAWVISSSDFYESSVKAMMRVAGTFAGYFVGLTCASLTEGNPIWQAVALFLIGAVGMSMRYRSKYSYGWTIGSATAFILLILNLTDPGSVYETGRYRLYEIISGVVASWLCGRLLRPVLGLPLVKAEAKSVSPASSTTLTASELRMLAIVGGSVPVITTALWSWLNLPSLVQAIATAFVTLDRDVAAAQIRVTQRVLGCLLGGCTGLLAAEFATSSLFGWSVVLLGGIFLFSRLHLSKGPSAYVGTQGGVAFILSVVTGNHPPDTIGPVIGRIAGMTGGVLVIAGVCFVLRLWQERSASESIP
ncbi:MAG TPA: FUSC family protein [Chthoniobacterales bacterium]|nr:FUSC family protein [Chthoniobacterales bacterium]